MQRYQLFNFLLTPGSKARWGIIRLALLLFLPLMALSAAAHPFDGSSITAVGDNAIFLRGPGGGLSNGDGYVEIPHSPDLNPSGGEITIEAWVKRNATDQNETIVGNGWQTSYWFGFSGSGRLRFTPYGNSGLVDSDSIVQAGRWAHVAITYDGVTRNYYINGILDKSTTDSPGALVPASAGEILGIGYDPDEGFAPNYFSGGIDNVRIWNVVRSPTEIKAGMFQSFAAAQPGLLAEWPLNGNATDPAGGHDGTEQNGYFYANEGAIPHDIRIPQLSVTPSLNGVCSSSEYSNATKVSVDFTEVWLMHTADDLWICFDSPTGLVNPRFAVYLDADYTRLDPSQPEHLLLELFSDDATQAREGDSAGGYTATSAADGLWDANYSIGGGEFPDYRGEFRIGVDLLGGWDHVIGLALGRDRETPVRGSLRMWPALAVSTQPSTWSSAILGGMGDPRTFSGRVVYQPRDPQADPKGIAGVTVNLIGSDPSGGEALVATDETNLNGGFSVTGTDDYTQHRLEMGSPPKGFQSQEAEADPPGTVVDARTIDYGTAAAGTYPDNTFILGDVLPYIVDTQNGPFFLIIAPEAIIDSGALDEFVSYKFRLGFAVSVVSVENIDSNYSGSNLRDKIRAAEKDYLDIFGDRFQYVLLVGNKDTIPVSFVTPWFNGKDGDGNKDLDACLATPASSNSNMEGVKIKYTEWYYADLVSNFDSNGNGCLLDGVRAKSEDFVSGYSPDSKPKLQATVAVGRLPFNTESAVRTALTNSMQFEQQAQSFKRRTVLAMSNVFLKGQYWSPKDSLLGYYTSCPGGVDKNCQSGATDGAYLAERLRSDFLNSSSYLSAYFYEGTKPPSASPVVSPQPLEAQNVIDELNDKAHGLVNLAGHGSAGGVSRTYWNNKNGNLTVESPTSPIGDPPKSQDEISGGQLLYTYSLSSLSPDNGRGSIYVVAACSTGNPNSSSSMGATLLEDGHGVAWVGGLSMVNVGPWKSPGNNGTFSIDYYTTRFLLDYDMRLGDAVWQTLQRQASVAFSGSTEIATGLYGDPSLSYWGNPGGQSTLAAWPMLRHNPRGQGYTTLAGPEVPRKRWEYSGAFPGTNTVHPAPVVGNDGEVIVAHGTYVDVLRQGELYQRLNLDGPAFGTPALAADGTIYAMDANGKLYAFAHNYLSFHGELLFELRTRSRRWTMEIGGLPQTSPIIGADGYIYVTYGSTNSILRMVRPDGVTAATAVMQGIAIDAVAISADRQVYIATNNNGSGNLYQFNASCTGGIFGCKKLFSHHSTSANSTAPLLAYGAVYVGRSNGQVIKLSTSNLTQQQSFQADSMITTGPIAGPGGQVLVGTANGTLYSLTKNLDLRWQRSTGGSPVAGMPAFSADGLYVVKGNLLRAYNPFSGAPLWERNLGSGASVGSVAVGYGRSLYLQVNSGKVMAYDEGWSNTILAVAANPILIDNRLKAIEIEWLHTAPPIEGTQSPAPGLAAPQGEAIGLLLQRSSDQSNWEDVAILPPGTEVFTDTKVLDGTTYFYRVQVLDSEGNDSDFVSTLVGVESLPAVPQAPTLSAVTPLSAGALHVEWSSPANDTVTGYRVERSQSETGPFSTAIETGGETTAVEDSELEQATTYYYRVIALNDTGESTPSAVLNATTYEKSLPAPQDAQAVLMEDGQILVSWSGAPQGASAVVEYSEGPIDGYQYLATTGGDGPFGHYPGEPSTYVYRIKFVKDSAESDYAETGVVYIPPEYGLHLPLIIRR